MYVSICELKQTLKWSNSSNWGMKRNEMRKAKHRFLDVSIKVCNTRIILTRKRGDGIEDENTEQNIYRNYERNAFIKHFVHGKHMWKLLFQVLSSMYFLESWSFQTWKGQRNLNRRSIEPLQNKDLVMAPGRKNTGKGPHLHCKVKQHSSRQWKELFSVTAYEKAPPISLVQGQCFTRKNNMNILQKWMLYMKFHWDMPAQR